MMRQKKRKIVLTGAAAVLCSMVMLAGTYAWTSLSQTALNEVEGSINSGGRLHDDFDGSSKKDIYVENYTSAPGTDLIVRVRLREYMELTKSNNTTVYPTGATKADKTTWDVYELPNALTLEGTDSSADHYGYSLWKFGGQKVYLPTLNKDNDSQQSDLNGTKAKNYEDYEDYRSKQAGDQVTLDGTAYTLEETLNATVITMTQWETKYQSEPGAYWIYDDGEDGDGWFYWGDRLSPGDATGLLLNGIQMSVEDKADSFYYGIYVESQMVTPGEVTVLYDTSVQGGGGVGTKAQTLLEQLAVQPVGVDPISESDTQQTEEELRQAQIQEIYEKMLEEEAKEAEEREKTEEPTITDGDETEKPEEATSGDSTTDDGTEPPADTQPPMEAPSDSKDELPDDEQKDQTPEETPDSDLADTEDSAGVTISDGTQDTGSISKTLFGLFRHGVQ